MLAPYAAQLIDNRFDLGHGNEPNAAVQLLSHVLLGAGWWSDAAMEILGGVEDLMGAQERMKTGCRNMGMDESCGSGDK
ncbi:hypothetical protein [Stenotrophomonas mori]|uniref:Uncharacterized protein n=1 Tax=Stenotrophomonas mori TaxID=2871096 RepID=A0ABT0SGJ1_9GAMM|nr:hypothetical protein [Stenotrophomonas mori]MCL7714445.1 hypothetical protein [Stenotrophomonas mori]